VETKEKFTVKAMYDQLTVIDYGKTHTRIWKAKIPYKIKIFLWLIETKAILTKDNMIKRKWVGDPSCQFCEGLEDISHLLFRCFTAKCVWAIVAKSMRAQEIPTSVEQYWAWVKKQLPGDEHIYALGFSAICRAIWLTRNKSCFDKKTIKHPAEIVVLACALMKYWAGLYNTEVQEHLVEGADIMLGATGGGGCHYAGNRVQAAGGTR
jgi:hypothetical protein